MTLITKFLQIILNLDLLKIRKVSNPDHTLISLPIGNKAAFLTIPIISISSYEHVVQSHRLITLSAFSILDELTFFIAFMAFDCRAVAADHEIGCAGAAVAVVLKHATFAEWAVHLLFCGLQIAERIIYFIFLCL